MRYSGNIWQQLKNLTADDLIAALERDGWKRDVSDGAFIPYIHPTTKNRIIIHYHPRKTYGPKLLKSLLEDIGWDERDLARIGLIARRSKSVSRRERIAEVGDENPNGQLFVRETDVPGTDHNQYIWELLCRHCGNKYGANGSDFHHRKCPKCQSGVPGFELIEM
ncbi:MAG TPA: type II toxin-antitoxin system HicA family toxin [Candidatus Angelobacter sp.]|jgi:predicted RNA binding protein YcfA (HicA-like mRNA interferase family)|nr:type II toxin-antitoxin system HicA family toxin [Candidatus Angelobacter sp.]